VTSLPDIPRGMFATSSGKSARTTLARLLATEERRLHEVRVAPGASIKRRCRLAGKR
jgi:hypothetical protein